MQIWHFDPVYWIHCFNRNWFFLNANLGLQVIFGFQNLRRFFFQGWCKVSYIHIYIFQAVHDLITKSGFTGFQSLSAVTPSVNSPLNLLSTSTIRPTVCTAVNTVLYETSNYLNTCYLQVKLDIYQTSYTVVVRWPRSACFLETRGGREPCVQSCPCCVYVCVGKVMAQ